MRECGKMKGAGPQPAPVLEDDDTAAVAGNDVTQELRRVEGDRARQRRLQAWNRHLEESSIEQLTSEFSMERCLSEGALFSAIAGKLPRMLTDEEAFAIALWLEKNPLPHEVGEWFGKIAPYEVSNLEDHIYQLSQRLDDISREIGVVMPYLRDDFLPFLSVEWAAKQRAKKPKGKKKAAA